MPTQHPILAAARGIDAVLKSVDPAYDTSRLPNGDIRYARRT